MELAKIGIDLAAELSRQIITLSSAIIAFTITFTTPLLSRAHRTQRRMLLSSWMSYFLAIISALWHLSALTGSLLEGDTASVIDIRSAMLPALLQIVSFLVGTALLVLFAARNSVLIGLSDATHAAVGANPTHQSNPAAANESVQDAMADQHLPKP